VHTCNARFAKKPWAEVAKGRQTAYIDQNRY
jgi:hypothetical protein